MDFLKIKNFLIGLSIGLIVGAILRVLIKWGK